MSEVKSSIRFLGRDLEIPIFDREDPNFLILLSQIEFAEIHHGNGLTWYRHLKENYGLKFANEQVEVQIESLLQEFKEENKDSNE